ncbi:MAG TPA: ATP-binding protein [Frankiaceae bacterium]|nr:ATP-binding protein [Frankiaceae bacterium]
MAVDPKRQDAPNVPDDTSAFVLANDDRAPGQARRAVRGTLTGWRLFAVIDDAVLAVSELVTNAVRHGLPPVGLLLRRRDGQVRIDVDDARPEPVALDRKPADFAESGRGLGIVSGVADDVGSEHIPGDGKFVFASWNIADPPAEAGLGGESCEPPVTGAPSSPTDGRVSGHRAAGATTD